MGNTSRLSKVTAVADPAVQDLVKRLTDAKFSERRDAITQLSAMGDRAKPSILNLINLLEDRERKVRRMAADAILRLDSSCEILVEALRKPDLRIQESVVSALSRIQPGMKEAVPALVGVLNDGDIKVRSTAIDALSKIGSPSVPALIDSLKVEDKRAAALETLGKIGPSAEPAIGALVELLRRADAPTLISIVDALGAIGVPAVPALVSELPEMQVSVRRHSIRVLGRILPAAKQVVPVLVAALAEPSVSEDAVVALGQFGLEAQDAIPALLDHLPKASWTMRQGIYAALGSIGQPAVPALVKCLGNAAGGATEEVMAALEQIGPIAGESVPALTAIATARNQKDSLRYHAAKALVAIISDISSSVALLLNILADSRPERPDGVLEILLHTGSLAIPSLIQHLSDPNPDVRSCAIEVLDAMGPDFVETLTEAVGQETSQQIRDGLEAVLNSTMNRLRYVHLTKEERSFVEASGIPLSLLEGIDFMNLDDWQLEQLVHEAPAVIDVLNKLNRGRGPTIYYFTGSPPASGLPSSSASEPLRELQQMIQERRATLAQIAAALPSGTAQQKSAQPSEEVEAPRYTDVEFYNGHLFPSDDLAAATAVPTGTSLAAGEIYTLCITIRAVREGVDAELLAPRPVRNPRKDKEPLSLYVLARAYLPGIKVTEPFETILWPYNEDSESALFRMETWPSGSGPISRGVIEVRIYDKSLDLLDIVKVQVSVVDQDWAEGTDQGSLSCHLVWPGRRTAPTHVYSNVHPRLLSIHVAPGSVGYQFEFIFRELTGDLIEIPIVRDISVQDLNRLLVRVRDFWSDLVITNYASQLTVTRATFGERLNQLRDLGIEAWSLLFGNRYSDRAGSSEKLGELLAGVQASEGALVQISYNDSLSNFIFPWNILHPPTDESSSADPLRFWGTQYQIEQVIGGPKMDSLEEEPVQVLFALDSHFGNATVQQELLRKYQVAASGRLVVGNPISDQGTLFKELVRIPPPHLLYFYCHGYSAATQASLRPDGIRLLRERIEAVPVDSPARDALDTLLALTAKMSDESWMYIGESEVKESKLTLQRFFAKRRPIVFLNMCQSADLLPSMSCGLTRVFIDHNASAVIGTESPMTAVFASAFAETVFDNLFTGDDVGTSLWKARRYFLKDDIRNPLGLAYTLYGRAVAKLGVGPVIENKFVGGDAKNPL
jgi:HEAT repeat protein